jgi:hypothetical protein
MMFVTKIKIHIQLWQVFCYHHTILTCIVAKKISVVIPPMEFNEPKGACNAFLDVQNI